MSTHIKFNLPRKIYLTLSRSQIRNLLVPFPFNTKPAPSLTFFHTFKGFDLPPNGADHATIRTWFNLKYNAVSTASTPDLHVEFASGCVTQGHYDW
jgi:hypothetical protein